MSAKIMPLNPTSGQPEYAGQYLVTKPRKTKAGTRFEHWFLIPAKYRFDEWDKRYPASIRLPADKLRRTGKDPKKDPSERAAAFAEAAILFAAFNKLRDAPEEGGQWPRGSLRWLCHEWLKSDWFNHDLSANTQKLYRNCLQQVQEWADRNAAKNRGLQPMADQIPASAIATFLHNYDDRPDRRRNIRRVLKNVFAFAIELGLRETNPVDGIVLRRTRGASVKMVLWSQAFVDAVCEWADENERPELAAMVQLEWDTGRRPADVFRLVAMNDMDRQSLLNGTLNASARPMLYDPRERAIMGWVEKTRRYIEIPLDEATIAAVERICPAPTDNRRHLFVHPEIGEPYTTDTFKWMWNQARDYAATKLKDKTWKGALWRHGRASAIVRNKRAGLDDGLIITLSDHSDPETVYKHYWVPDDSQAAEAKRRRREAESRNAD